MKRSGVGSARLEASRTRRRTLHITGRRQWPYYYERRGRRLRVHVVVMQCDIKGREIKAGDLLKVPHFTAARRRTRIYMYKLVCRTDDRLTITESGEYLYAVDVCDIYRKGSLDKAHKCLLSVVGACEIIDGGTVDGDDLFWERKRLDNEAPRCRECGYTAEDAATHLDHHLCGGEIPSA